MREMDISMAMICQIDSFHLQRRNGPKRIGAAGLVGCFGGKVEQGETPKEVIIREIPEETSISIVSGDTRQIDSFSVESDFQHQPIKINATVFEIILPYGTEVVAKEGELVSWTPKEIKEHESQLTPATREFFSRYFE